MLSSSSTLFTPILQQSTTALPRTDKQHRRRKGKTALKKKKKRKPPSLTTSTATSTTTTTTTTTTANTSSPSNVAASLPPTTAAASKSSALRASASVDGAVALHPLLPSPAQPATYTTTLQLVRPTRPKRKKTNRNRIKTPRNRNRKQKRSPPIIIGPITTLINGQEKCFDQQSITLSDLDRLGKDFPRFSMSTSSQYSRIVVLGNLMSTSKSLTEEDRAKYGTVPETTVGEVEIPTSTDV